MSGGVPQSERLPRRTFPSHAEPARVFPFHADAGGRKGPVEAWTREAIRRVAVQNLTAKLVPIPEPTHLQAALAAPGARTTPCAKYTQAQNLRPVDSDPTR